MPRTLPLTLDRKMTFDPIREREHLDEIYGVALYMERDLEEVSKIGKLASHASGMLRCAIRCLLVGYDASGRELLEKAKLWLETAIANKEPLSSERTTDEDFFVYERLALCNWLLTGKHDQENFDISIRNCNRYHAEQNKKDKYEVELALPRYMDAKAYQDALRLIESPPSLKVPASSTHVRGPVGIAYVISAHHARNEFTKEEIQKAIQRFLKHTIGKLAGKGYYEDLAHWLKVAYFNEAENPLAPKQCLLRMYDYLIDVEYPGEA